MQRFVLAVTLGLLSACSSPQVFAAPEGTPPRIVHQPAPVLDATLRDAGPATVVVTCSIDELGAVESASVESSSDARFDAPALAAVRKWRFEPATIEAKPVKARMRFPVTFPAPSAR
jgi:protein TonB